MLPAHATLTREFEQVLAAAQDLGLRQESARLARRAQSLDQPFMLHVMGARGEGKSTVIDRLAGAGVTDSAGDRVTWLNVYRRPSGQRECAEVYWRSAPGSPEVVPIDQARTLSRGTTAFASNSTADLERIIWHVDAEGLSDDLALAEVPCTREGAPDVSFTWEADAILWVTSAVSASAEHRSGSLDLIKSEKAPMVSTMCVLTHMDAVGRSAWSDAIRQMRSGTNATFDHVVPFGLNMSADGSVMSEVTEPLRRVVYNWYVRGAGPARIRAHEHFLGAVRRFVLGRIAREVDQLLEEEKRLLSFGEAVTQKLDRCIVELDAEVENYLTRCEQAGLEYGRRLEQADSATQVEPYAPPIAESVFFGRLQAALAEVAIELSPSAPASDTPHRHLRLVRFGSHLPLPPPPLAVLSTLRHHRPEQHSVAATATIFDEQSGEGMAHDPVEAAIFEPVDAVISRWASECRTAVANWLEAAKEIVVTHVMKAAGAAFHARFGCAPEDVPGRLQRLDEHYARLSGRSFEVPAPHLPEGVLSPSEFLRRAKQPSFVREWNRKLLSAFLDDALPSIGRRIQQELELYGDEVERAWSTCRETLDESLDIIWTVRGGRLFKSGEARWAFDWATSLLPDELQRPMSRVSSSVFVDARASESLSLFITSEGSFTDARATPSATSPASLAAEAIQRRVRAEAIRSWGEEKEVAVALKEVRTYRKRAILSTLALVATAAMGLMIFGINLVSLPIAASFVAGGALIIRRSLRTYVREAVESQRMRNADELHGDVSRTLKNRIMRLQELAGELVDDRQFRDETLTSVLSRTSGDGAAVPSYGALIRHLYQLPSRSLAA